MQARVREKAKRYEYNQRYYRKLQQDPGRYGKMRKQQAEYLRHKATRRRHPDRP